MTPEEFEQKMQEIQKENGFNEKIAHEDMDDLMCEVLISLGYVKGIEIFKAQPKWYE